MENLLQVLIVAFMFFLCTLCLFAVVIIVRDIIHESAMQRRERYRTDHLEPAPMPVRAENVPCIAEKTFVEAPAEADTVEKCEQCTEPVEEIAEETVDPPKADVTDAPEESAPAEDTEEENAADGVVSFNRMSMTLEEKYGMLSAELRRYFDDIVKYAASKEGVKELKHTGCYDYKIGAYKVLRITVKRGEIICEFQFIDSDFNQYVNESGAKIKQSATQLRVSEPSAVGAAKDGIDLICKQIAEDKERKKELARAKRRERNRLARENAEGVAAEASETGKTEETVEAAQAAETAEAEPTEA